MNYRPAVITWLALLILLGISLLATAMASTALRYTVHFLCAIAMAALVMVVFMQLRAASGLLRLFALGGLLWIALLLMLTLADVLTR
ncbi:oxidase [Microbulbifer rhizosphaerae]|uniref:Cytochrome c oxidase subunit 4 n=1 Tax=Microbulbifer rhizosphaerae TaxID=1562603 RepID=A0A7W4Z8F1_9GAMM|nr:oxidase [Microbulbifer rhizosphaerae]MBB3060491.1 cytochrome c oxidase subunit 4 [Microbulbifer rhizosphaerae]